MHENISFIDKAIIELESLKKILNKKKIDQVNSIDEKDLIKATSYSWIKFYQPKLSIFFNDSTDISKIHDSYCRLLDFSDKRTKRAIYKNIINKLKNDLIKLRSIIIKKIISGEIVYNDSSVMPDFSILISDKAMISIIQKRWAEIENCLKCEAPLASTVMMGGLIESVLIAKINKFDDKSVLFKQKSTPKDYKTNRPKQLGEWMLKDYIDVLSEIKVITKPSADFSRLIRDYRNYIHPEKELRMGESIVIGDAKLFWTTTTNLIKQILDK
ncbi:MAG: hypothetical protein WCW77_01150 [Patescibacteria group bacterium]|jgi:hypothetical protein